MAAAKTLTGGYKGRASFVKLDPENEWNLQLKLASGPITIYTVVYWPLLLLKIMSFVKVYFEMRFMVEVRYYTISAKPLRIFTITVSLIMIHAVVLSLIMAHATI